MRGAVAHLVSAVWKTELLASLTEDELVHQTLQGSRDAFDEVVRRYQKPIYNFICNYVGNHEVAQDAFQESFLRAFRNLRKYRIGTNFSAWLHKVALNASKDCLKRQRRNDRSEARDNDNYSPLAMVPDRNLSPHERLERRELQRIVQSALQCISAAHREVILLYQFQGFSYEEIAGLLGCPLGTVKSRIHYAMKHLEQVLDPVMRADR